MGSVWIRVGLIWTLGSRCLGVKKIAAGMGSVWIRRRSLHASVLVGCELTLGFGLAGLFFVRFWRKTRDRLFAGDVREPDRAVRRAALLGTRGDHLYWIRFVAFALILAAILDKNWYRKPAA